MGAIGPYVLKFAIWLYGHPDAVIQAIQEYTAVKEAIDQAKNKK